MVDDNGIFNRTNFNRQDYQTRKKWSEVNIFRSPDGREQDAGVVETETSDSGSAETADEKKKKKMYATSGSASGQDVGTVMNNNRGNLLGN